MSQELEGTLTNTANLVGTFGSEGGGGTSNYNDLINKPSINSVTLQGNKTATQLGFAEVATSGNYNDLTNKPTIPAAQVNSDWNATSGVAEILNKPNIPAAQVNSDWNATSGVAEILNKPTLSAVATSGDYDDLTNKPTIPAAQVNSDWNSTSGVSEILNKPTVYQNAASLPISGNDSTDTKTYIDNGLSGKADKSELYNVYPTEQESGAIAHFTDGADNIPVKSLVSQIVATGGGGTPDAPIAINGFDNGIITRCGKNLYNINNQTKTTFNTYCLIYLPTNSDITFSTNIVQSGLYAEYYDNDNWVEIAKKYDTQTLTFNTGNLNYIRLMTYNKNTQATEFQAEFGTTATAYEPYIDNTYTFAFGQTVYGGHFDNKGNLVVTHGYIASYNGETINEPWVSSMDNYVPNTSPSTGAQVVYPLTTPNTLAITSQDIPTLLGENNFFSNTGDVEVNYHADIGLYIDKKISSLAQT